MENVRKRDAHKSYMATEMCTRTRICNVEKLFLNQAKQLKMLFKNLCKTHTMPKFNLDAIYSKVCSTAMWSEQDLAVLNTKLAYGSVQIEPIIDRVKNILYRELGFN